MTADRTTLVDLGAVPWHHPGEDGMTSTRHLVLAAGLLGLCAIAVGILAPGGSLTVPRSARAPGKCRAGGAGPGRWPLAPLSRRRGEGTRARTRRCRRSRLARCIWRGPREPKLGKHDRRRRRLHGDRARFGD